MSKFPSSYKDTSQSGLGSSLSQYDFILSWIHQQKPYFPIRSHSQVLSRCTFGGDNIQPSALSNQVFLGFSCWGLGEGRRGFYFSQILMDISYKKLEIEVDASQRKPKEHCFSYFFFVCDKKCGDRWYWVGTVTHSASWEPGAPCLATWSPSSCAFWPYTCCLMVTRWWLHFSIILRQKGHPNWLTTLPLYRASLEFLSSTFHFDLIGQIHLCARKVRKVLFSLLKYLFVCLFGRTNCYTGTNQERKKIDIAKAS